MTKPIQQEIKAALDKTATKSPIKKKKKKKNHITILNQYISCPGLVVQVK